MSPSINYDNAQAIHFRVLVANQRSLAWDCEACIIIYSSIAAMELDVKFVSPTVLDSLNSIVEYLGDS